MASSMIAASYSPITSVGTVTSWLPVNTAWSAPDECSTLFLIDALSPGQMYLNDPKYPNVVLGAPSCLPPQVSTWWYNSPASIAPTIYSLGGYSFFCPSAYSTIFSTATSLTTTIGCCPSNYNWLSTLLPGGQVPQCNSILPPGMNVTFAQTNAGANNYNDGFTLTSSSVSTSFTLRGVQVNGYIFPGAPTTSSTITSSTSSTSSASELSRTSSPDTVTTSPAVSISPGLSQGAKIGVSVGVTLWIIIFASLLAVLLLFRRKRQKRTQYSKSELDGTNMPGFELDTDLIRHELDSETTRHEMGASPTDRPPAAEMG